MITTSMRNIFKPGAILDGKELVSYPWPENGRIYINARTTVGDPTSMKTFEIINGRLEAVSVNSKYSKFGG